jgi:hypothetical protein
MGIIGKRFVSDRAFEVSMKALEAQEGALDRQNSHFGVIPPFPIV